MSPAARQIVRWVWFPFGVTVRFILRNGKRLAVSVVGFVLLLAGLVMMVTPGPGLLLIIAGLAVLGTEYVWAQRLLNVARTRGQQALTKVRRRRTAPAPTNGPDSDGGPVSGGTQD